MHWGFWSAKLGPHLEETWHEDGAVCLQHLHPEDGKIHEMGEAKFRYMESVDLGGGFRVCTAKIKFTPGNALA